MKPQQPTLEDYYARRAKEYEEIYFRDDPVRQREQAEMQQALKEAFAGKRVLEIACGTGYWTQYVSEAAVAIVATDYNQEVLDVASHKQFVCPVSFQRADAYNLPYEREAFTGGLANFWFSHVPKARIHEFLSRFHGTLKSGSPIFIADNVNVPGVGGELIVKPNDENTYKLRTLKNGEKREVLKNYFIAEELIDIFQQYDPTFSQQNINVGECFWRVKYEV